MTAQRNEQARAAATLARIDLYVGAWFDEMEEGGEQAMVALSVILDKHYGRPERDLFKGED